LIQKDKHKDHFRNQRLFLLSASFNPDLSLNKDEKTIKSKVATPKATPNASV
jgi:hypothetical protein